MVLSRYGKEPSLLGFGSIPISSFSVYLVFSIFFVLETGFSVFCVVYVLLFPNYVHCMFTVCVELSSNYCMSKQLFRERLR